MTYYGTERANDISSKDIDGYIAELGEDRWNILEINQVVAYFNYANRTVLGLGVDLEKQGIGFSPNDNDDEENWGHS